MLCKRCKTVMRKGTSYEKNKAGKSLAKRFYECSKCHGKIYTKDPNFQEYMKKILDKCENK